MFTVQLKRGYAEHFEVRHLNLGDLETLTAICTADGSPFELEITPEVEENADV